MFYNDNLENGMVLGNDDEPRLSQWDKEWETQDDERDNQWFEENMGEGWKNDR